MLSSRVTLVLAAIVLCFGVVQMVRPFSRAPFNPVLMIVIGLLLIVRYGMARQRQKRLELMKGVPKRPLGLNEDGEGGTANGSAR
jgi:hypothetical protein